MSCSVVVCSGGQSSITRRASYCITSILWLVTKRRARTDADQRTVALTKPRLTCFPLPLFAAPSIYVLMTAVLWSLDGSKANVSRELDRLFRSACCHIHFTDSDEIAGELKKGRFTALFEPYRREWK